MAKNKKKKKEVEKQYGNGIAPISLNSNFNINTPTVETKKTTKKAKKETKKKKKEKETIKVSDLVKSVDPDTPIAQKYNTEEYNQYYNSLSNKQKAKENEKVAKQISKQKNTELNKSRTKANKELMPVLAQTLDEQFKRQNQLTFNPTAEDKTNLTENYGVTSEKSPYSKNYKKTEKEKASANVMSKYGIEAKENDVLLADYLKNYYEQDNQEPTIAEKILSPVTQAGTLVTGIAKPFGYQQYQRKDGLKTYLPDKLDLNYEKTGEKIDSGLGKFIYEAGGEASKILASSGINAIAPGAGTGMYWASMTGNNISQARNKATEKGEEATGKVLLNAAAKTGLEYVTGKFLGSATKGLTGGKASELEKAITDKVYDAKFLQSLSDSTKLKIAKLVGTGVSEGTEETIQDPIEKLIDILTFGDDGKHKNVKELVTDLETYKDALKAGAAGALTAGMVEGANMVTNSSYYDQGAAEIEKNKRTKNEQKVIDAELQNRIATEFNGEATAKEIAQLQKEIIEDMEKGYVSTDTIEQTLGGKTYKELAKINQKKNNIQQEIDELQKKADNNELSSLEEKQKLADLKEEIKTIDDSEVRKKLNQEIQETIKNDISLQESYKETGRRKENYSVDLSKVENEKQKAVYQKAMDSGVLNNSNKTHALVDMIAKISSDKNIDFDFTNNEQLEKSGFGVNGRNINGYVTDSGITINLNSQKAINRIVGHELTHTFEGTTLYTELQDSLKDFLGSEWDNQLEKYKELYKGVKNANIENELTSDLIGDYLFTDENYVKNLSTKNKNLFEKVYDEIKYLYNVATAGSKEKRQLEKVKRTFDRIYNETESKVTSKDAKYSLSEDSQGRELNENQKEYFKNSKVVDDNGNLKVMYNGGGDYTTFDNTKMSDQSKWGKGIYLTEDSNIANMYGDNVKEVYVDIENPINQTEKTISFDTYNKLIQELYDEEADRYDYDMYGNDLELLWDATNKGSWADYGEQLRNIVGVDGLIIDDSNPAERMAIAFNSNQIKNVSNENPTSNVDIRYDISVKDAKTTKDNEGRKLSKDQLSYFKDSKAVDNDGNLITVYHTTTNDVAQFNEFNPVGTDYYRFGDQVVNYYTDDKNMSGSYANQDYVMADTSKITDKKGVNDILVETNNKLNGDRIFVIETNANGTYFLYDKLHKNNHLMTKLYKSQEELFKNIKQDLQERAGFREKTQYEGYVNITNPYVVDAEARNWNQVVQQSNDFIDELDERVSEDTKNNLTRLYQESANKSADAREIFNMLDKITYQGMDGHYSNVDENIRKVNNIVRAITYEKMKSLIETDYMDVNGWYRLAEELKEQGVIGESTKDLIINDFKLPEDTKQWLKENYTKEIPIQYIDMYSGDITKAVDKLGNKTTLQDIYEKKAEAYEEFDKYRYPQSYFKEKYAEENSMYTDLDLEDMLDTRAATMGVDAVMDEIAQAASVGFSKPGMIRLWGTSKTTNDVVKEIIASNKDGSTNYDGVIIKNVVDYGGKSEGSETANDLYITFNSNQFKAADNTNPTEDADIRYSLEKTNQIKENSEDEELSEGQKEYFKNSKAVTKDGRLWLVHHGTKADFNTFDITKAGENGVALGNGFYFTNNKGTAYAFTEDGMYGTNDNQLKSGYVNIEKPASRTEKTMTYNEFKDLYKALNENPNMYDEEMGMSEIDALLSDYGDIYNDKENTIKNFYDSYNDDVSLIDNLSYMYSQAEMYKTLRDVTGYDGIIIDNPTGYDAYEKYFVTFNPDQFKLAKNENPTSNPDIRYSLTKDSKGRELSEGQQEYFKDSKVRDENGNLMPLYHGSNSEFTIFDINKAGESNKNARVGFWFTPTKSGAENFARDVWYGDNTPTTYEVYLNLKNPKIYESFDNSAETERLNNLYKESRNREKALYDKHEYDNIGLSNVIAFLNFKTEENTLKSLVNDFGYTEEQAKEYIEEAKQVKEIREESKRLEQEVTNSRYTDSYEQFRTDIYKMAGKSADDANFGGIGMALDNESQVVADYVKSLKEQGYDGIVIKNTTYDKTTMGGNNDQYIAFESNQIKNVDNLNPTSNADIRYDLSVKEAKTTKDNKGRKLSKEQLDLFADDKIIDNDGNLITVYHTTTNEVAQFNEFNPVGTPGYRFGDQEVNYYTDDKEMSGSYADQNYKMADTKKLNNIKEVKDYLYRNTMETGNVFALEEENGKYVLKQENEITKDAKKFVDSLKEQEIEQMRENIYYDEEMEKYDSNYAKVFSWNNFDEELQNKFNKALEKYMGTAELVKMQQEMIKYVENPNYILQTGASETINTYDNEQQMLRNIKSDIQKSNWTKNSKLQYEGYINITNPYIVDADGEYWNSVRYDYDNEKVNSYKNLSQEIKDKLIKLQQDSIDKFRNSQYEEEQLRETMKYHLTQRQEHLLDLFNTYIELDEEQRSGIAKLYGFEEDLETLKKEFESPTNYLHDYGGMTLKEFSKDYNRVMSHRNDYSSNTSYFYSEAPKILEGTGVPSNLDTWHLTGENFSEDAILENFESKKTTNDVVKEVIEMNKNGSNYDGVIIKNVVDYGGRAEHHAPHNIYITFKSNQFKAVDNTSPTTDADIRYSISKTDNQGRELSEGQQEYFRDSKVRDENGNLIVAHHGTDADFNIFRHEFISDDNKDGFGFYFTPNELKYDYDYKKSVYLDIKNPATSSEQIGEILRRQNELYDTIKNKEEVLKQIQKEFGVDGIIDNERNNIVAFNSNQIKNVDNLNPTENDDIRYSLDTNQKLSDLDNEIIKDNRGEYKGFYNWAKSITKNNNELQNELLFKHYSQNFEIPIKDNETRFYHGTDATYDYNSLKTMDFDEQTMDRNYGDYFYITPDKSFANIYGREIAEFIVPDDKILSLDEYRNEINNGKTEDELFNKYWAIEMPDGEYIVKDTTPLIDYSKQKAQEYINKREQENTKYSLDIAPISKNFLTEAEQDELDGLRAVENSGFSELTPEEQSRMYELENRANTILNKKAEKMLRSASYKAINTTTKIADNYLDFDAKQKKEFRSQMREFSNMTKDELVNADTYNKVKDIVSQYANKEYTYFDDSVESLKRELKHTKIQISDELKNQITDYGDFVKDSKLMLRRNSGQSVDKVYKEYSDMYPGFFSNDVWNEEEQLEALNDFVNHDFSVTEKYKLTDEDLRNATDLIYNKLLDNSLTQQDLIETEEILDKKVQKRTRSVVREELLGKMGVTPETIQVGKDISAIDFARTDPIRVNEKVFGWKTGQLINDATVNFTKHQEAERIRFLNKERQEIKDLGIKARSKESELVQKYGEKQYVDKNNEVHEYGDAELARDVQDAATREKIKNAARVLRQKYDTYIDRVNEVLTEMGYDEIPKRKDYMRHFVELDDKFSRWGLPFNKESMSAEDLPTDINGLTEFNRPGKSYFASANTRTGLQTTYDAITGIDGYLEGVSNLIYHTESIQRYRALSRLIRESYGREHGFDNIDLMTDEELAERIKDIQDNKLSKYVAWLDEQANSIAGKKGSLDRSVERLFGRRIYTALNTLKSQVGSNMTGFNVRSAMTNFASAIQGMSKTQKLAFAKGTISTINNIIHNDGMIDKSDFLTRRFGSDSLALKPWQKLSQAGQVFMNGTDYFTANQIWRSKYFENLQKGMSEEQAIKNADDFAARIMGDRSKGSTAELFNSKTLGFLSQFQLEVNNQWSSLIHDNKIDIQKGNKTPLGVTFELGQLFAASYLFNSMMKSLTGSDVMIDPIDMLLKIFKPDDDDEDDIVKRAQKVLGEFINQLPFANLITGGGRIPISEAFTGAQTLGKKLMGGTDNYGNEITWGDVKDDALESAAYWLLPTGYGQIRKTTKGLSMYDDKLPIAGSYTDSGNLRFSAEDTTLGKIKAGLFGQYSSKYAQDYIKSGYKSINASKLDEMKDLDMNSTEYRKYRQGLSEAGTSIQDKLDYISSLDVSDEDKTIMASNAAKKDIDMSEYKKYGTYEEFSYAQENPAKYQVMKYIGGYDTYKNYEKEINDIKADYDRNGKAITNSRKNKVIKYVNSLNLSRAQKAMLIKEQYPSFTKYDNEIASYVNKQNISYIDKASILKQLGFTAYDKQIINYIKQNYRTVEEQQRELEKLGFKVYNYNGKTYVR